MNTNERSGSGAGQLLGIAAVVAAALFGTAGVIGAVGYLVSVTRNR